MANKKSQGNSRADGNHETPPSQWPEFNGFGRLITVTAPRRVRAVKIISSAGISLLAESGKIPVIST